ncbi:MAG: T9SS type A sorting domain-containing protein [Bacteroidota bacterium]
MATEGDIFLATDYTANGSIYEEGAFLRLSPNGQAQWARYFQNYGPVDGEHGEIEAVGENLVTCGKKIAFTPAPVNGGFVSWIDHGGPFDWATAPNGAFTLWGLTHSAKNELIYAYGSTYLNGSTEPYAATLDYQGNVIRAAHFEYPSALPIPRAFKVAEISPKDGTIYVLGEGATTTGFMVSRFQADGTTMMWTKSYDFPGQPASNPIEDLHVDAAGDVYVCGRRGSILPQTSYIAKLNADGVLLDARRYSHSTRLQIRSIDVSGNSIMVAGAVLLQVSGVGDWRGFVARIRKDDLSASHWTYYSQLTPGQLTNHFFDIRAAGNGEYVVGGHMFASGSTGFATVARVDANGNGPCNPFNFYPQESAEAIIEEPLSFVTVPHAGGIALNETLLRLDVNEHECGSQKQAFANEDVLDFDLKLSPNPATDHLRLEGTAFDNIRHLNIVDMTGRTLLQIRQDQHQNIAIGQLPAGTYFLQCTFEDGHMETRRFLKQ